MSSERKTIAPEVEPEYVGAHSALTDGRCQNYLNVENSSPKRCDRDATHTIVMADGSSIHEIAMCDECGEPDDIGSHDRKWSGEVRGRSS
jgi:hypothetical protein